MEESDYPIVEMLVYMFLVGSLIILISYPFVSAMEISKEKLENEYIGEKVSTEKGKMTVKKVDCSMFLVWHWCILIGNTEDGKLIKEHEDDVLKMNESVSNE